MGLSHPSNLLSLLPSFIMAQRPALGPTQGGSRQVGAPGARPWFPPGIASTSVFLRLLLIFQAKVCCWFLSPLVPTHPGTCPVT